MNVELCITSSRNKEATVYKWSRFIKRGVSFNHTKRQNTCTPIRVSLYCYDVMFRFM